MIYNQLKLNLFYLLINKFQLWLKLMNGGLKVKLVLDAIIAIGNHGWKYGI